MTKDIIKELRDATGAGILDIKEALNESGGDKAKATEILRKKGAVKLSKKSDRIAKEGVVECYIHAGGKIGSLVELNCETDFVARTDDFKTLARDLALHIAAANPLYVSADDIPPEILEKEKEIYIEQMDLAKKPEDVRNKILEGKVAKFYEEVCLLEQPFVKDNDKKIKDLISEAVSKMGENVQIRRFARFVLGG